jgi:hypothetical protein
MYTLIIHMKKIALCFIISYSHELSKEHIWKTWIYPNRDIINVYFHYKNIKSIKSDWIRQHALPPKVIQPTSYYHVVCAYMATMLYALAQDGDNEWFCMLSDTCVPIISPQKFREIFERHHSHSILKWRKAYWNIEFHKRANLRLLPPNYHLAHDPWFVLCRQHVRICKQFVERHSNMFSTIDKGGLANESLFAIILHGYHLISSDNVINEVSTITDWTRRVNPTSPYSFFKSSPEDVQIIVQHKRANKYGMFLRKVDAAFPDAILTDLIYSADHAHAGDSSDTSRGNA